MMKIKYLIITLCFGLSLTSCNFFNNDKEIINKDNLRYVLNSKADGYIVYGSRKDVEEIIIPDIVNKLPVVEIGASAFINYPNLRSVTIPEGVHTIRERAFVDCKNLEEIDFPSTIKETGCNLFKGCDKLKYYVEDNIKYLGNMDNPYVLLIEAIDKTIPSFSFKEGTKVIYEDSFSGCDNITDIIIPDNVTCIGEKAFYDCNNLKNVKISDFVEVIGKYAFSWCTNIDSINLPKSLKVLNEIGIELTKDIEIPDGLISIPHEIAVNILYPNKDESILKYNVYENGIYIGNKNNPYMILLEWIDYNVSKVVIHNDVKFIDEGVSFESNWELNRLGNNIYIGSNENPYLYLVDVYDHLKKDLVIPKETRFIDSNLLSGTYVDKYTCINKLSGLNSIVVEKGNPVFDSRKNCNAIIKTATNELILGSNKTVIPREVTKIGDFAFYECKFSKIKIPNNVTELGYYAFYDCVNLKEINLPYGLTSLSGPHSLSGCSSLTKVVIPDSVSYMDGWIFYDSININEVVLPYGLEEISRGLFLGCTSLTKIKIPDSVKFIGQDAFSDCTSLRTIVIPIGVESMGWCAFSNCDNLAIYCEASSEPSTWDSEWDSNWNSDSDNNKMVYWAGEWEYDQNGNPVPLK